MSNQFILPIEQIINPTTGRPVFNARLFFGRQDATDLATNPASRVPVFFVAGNGVEVPLAQPVRTNVAGNPVNPAGAPVQIRVQVNPADTAYSFLAQTDGGAQVLYQARITPIDGDDSSLVNQKFAELAAVGSETLVGGVTAENVALAADIALGNFVTPEQFFVGDVSNPNADFRSAVQAALAVGKRLLLKREYGLSDTIVLPEGSVVTGISREKTGFFKLGSNVGTRNLIEVSGAGCALSNFKVDGKNSGSAPSNRLHLVALAPNCRNFNISQVDVYNATGYGHVTFGSESNPQVTGTYFDCYAENCQVPFEQIGALDVSLFRCRALGTERTLSLFHPYAGSKRVTYNDCHGFGVAGAGIEAVVTGGRPIGPFTFINSSINIAGVQSAIATLAIGVQAQVDMTFIGGSYTTSLGQSVTLNTPVKIKAFGTDFIGAGGFNCPFNPLVSEINLTDSNIEAEKNSVTDTAFALICNNATPIIIGGAITAKNSLGQSQAVLGVAKTYSGTKIVPQTGFPEFSPVFETGGTVSISTDSSTLGFVNIPLPTNTTIDKVSFCYSLVGTSDSYPAGTTNFTWFLVAPDFIRVRISSSASITGLKLSYRLALLP